jgi:hypothetical protein
LKTAPSPMTAGSGVQTMEAKFSVNSIALGNLRRRRGRYLLLIAGIVLAIYFVATALLFADTMFTSLRERTSTAWASRMPSSSIAGRRRSKS